ncbi:hypothetical protein KA344_18850, partial [bacterium]|nr:hypothetical protein [bacterium]
ISRFGAACVSTGVIPVSTQLPTMVDRVKPGSSGFYAGVCAGDKILSASVEDGFLQLKIERGSKIYLVKMRAKTDSSSRASLQSQTTRFDLWRTLQGFQVSLVIDHSGSMSRSVGNTDKVRWNWIKEQLGTFAQEAEQRGGSNFDLCLFNQTFSSDKGLTAARLAQALDSVVTTGDTVLAPALRATFERELALDSKKSLLLFVITDGEGLASNDNLEVIREYALKFKGAKRLKIVFIQAGYSEVGAQFVSNLATALRPQSQAVSVHTVLFDEVSQRGLAAVITPFLQQ